MQRSKSSFITKRKGMQILYYENFLDISNVNNIWGVLVIPKIWLWVYIKRHDAPMAWPQWEAVAFGGVTSIRSLTSMRGRSPRRCDLYERLGLCDSGNWAQGEDKGAPFSGCLRGRGLRILEDRSDLLLKWLMGQDNEDKGRALRGRAHR